MYRNTLWPSLPKRSISAPVGESVSGWKRGRRKPNAARVQLQVRFDHQEQYPPRAYQLSVK